MLSISCLSCATSLVDGVVLVAPCVMGIRWQKGITDESPDPKEPETSTQEAKEAYLTTEGARKVTEGTRGTVSVTMR